MTTLRLFCDASTRGGRIARSNAKIVARRAPGRGRERSGRRRACGDSAPERDDLCGWSQRRGLRRVRRHGGWQCGLVLQDRLPYGYLLDCRASLGPVPDQGASLLVRRAPGPDFHGRHSGRGQRRRHHSTEEALVRGRARDLERHHERDARSALAARAALAGLPCPQCGRADSRCGAQQNSWRPLRARTSPFCALRSAAQPGARSEPAGRLDPARPGEDQPRCQPRPVVASAFRWAVQGSNLRPPACKAGALPTELTARTGAPSGIRTRAPALKGP